MDISANLTSNNRIKSALSYGSAIVIVLCLIGFLPWLGINSVQMYYVAFLVALGLGIAHATIFNKFWNPYEPGHFSKGLLLTGTLMLICAIFLGIFYFLLRLNFNFLTFLVAFIIPYLIKGAYQNFLVIPPSEYKLSYYPFDRQLPDLDSIDFSETEVIQFVLNKDSEDDTQTSFSSRAPLNMPVSELFFAFIHEYNRKNPLTIIKFLNQNNEPFSWLFYRQGLFPVKHFLDPDLTFRENGVSRNQNIYAIRKMKDS